MDLIITTMMKCNPFSNAESENVLDIIQMQCIKSTILKCTMMLNSASAFVLMMGHHTRKLTEKLNYFVIKIGGMGTWSLSYKGS